MKSLIIMRGPPGAGKSTTIHSLGLQNHTLSSDMIRQIFGAPKLDLTGTFVISPKNNKEVWATFNKMVRHRMQNGELLVLDATHANRKDFFFYYQLAIEYNYRVGCIDFSNMPIDVVLNRNKNRDPLRIVPEAVVHRMHNSQQFELPQSVTVFPWTEDDSQLKAVREWLNHAPSDFSHYKKIHHIGDLQGCASVLQKYLPADLPTDECFIFIGDICDRGIENGKTLRYLLDIYKKPNVYVVYGNHEVHLDNWSKSNGDRDTLSGGDEFLKHTLPQIIHAGITKAEVASLVNAMQYFVIYRYQEKNVLVTHSGLSTVPQHFEWLTPKDYYSGTGAYTAPIDQIFSALAPDNWYQVHGHRNAQMIDIMTYERSFNLEGRVEFGGNLCILTLDKTGFSPIYISNDIYKSPWDSISGTQNMARSYTQSTWVTPSPPLLQQDDLEVLNHHPLINTKTTSEFPNIVSYNFSREAFFKAQWDTSTIKARGLFVHPQRKEIVARSYEKFFNLNERPETKEETFSENAVYPIQTYLKENGFLGILGYCRDQDTLFFASKSTPVGPFAECFRRIFEATLTRSQQNFIKTYLKDTHASMVFEVIDPIFDPHIIEYEQQQIILLDVVRRTLEFERLEYKKLKKLAKKCSLPLKEVGPVLHNPQHLKQWLDTVRKPGWSHDGQHLEGFILEDKNGFLVKIKLDYYNHWKRMRSLKDRIRAIRGTNKSLKRNLETPREQAFASWCLQCSTEFLKNDIITLRRHFENGTIPESEIIQPVAQSDPEERGFVQALESIASTSHFQPKTANAILERALENPKLAAILISHTICNPILETASQETIETWLQKYPKPTPSH